MTSADSASDYDRWVEMIINGKPRRQKVVETVDSTSDQRTVNNVMRHEYRVLGDLEKDQMKSLKDQGLAFVESCDRIGTSREMSLAKTKMEEAVMWAVKHITR